MYHKLYSTLMKNCTNSRWCLWTYKCPKHFRSIDEQHFSNLRKFIVCSKDIHSHVEHGYKTLQLLKENQLSLKNIDVNLVNKIRILITSSHNMVTISATINWLNLSGLSTAIHFINYHYIQCTKESHVEALNTI